MVTLGQPPRVKWERDARGEDYVSVPDVCGPLAWGMLHRWAQAVNEDMCPSCGKFAIEATTALHDVVNAKLGKPIKDPENLRKVAAIFGMAARGETRAQAHQLGRIAPDKLGELHRWANLLPVRAESRYGAAYIAWLNGGAVGNLPARQGLSERRAEALRSFVNASCPYGAVAEAHQHAGEISVLEPIPDAWGSRCRDPFSGLFVPRDGCGEQVDGGRRSPETFAIGPNGVTRYEFVYRVVEAAQLVVSHNPFTFEPEPKFPSELQPRLRDRAASRAQVEGVAAHLDPDALLTDFRSLDRGAPIIGPDMVVESGNGRVMAVIIAARNYPDVYARYRQALRAIAPEYGIAAADVDKFKAPLLVRARRTEVDRRQFVQEANAPPTLTASAIEQARADAERITLAALTNLEIRETESIEDALRATRNAAFVNGFLGKLPPNEVARLMDAGGKLNQDGLRRVVAAVFVRAFPGDAGLHLAERAFETLDPDIRNVLAGITRALGPLAQVEALIVAGARDAGLSIGPDIAAAVPVYVRIKRTAGGTVSDYLSQAQLFGRELSPFQERLLRFLDQQARAPKRIAVALRSYATLVLAQPPPQQTTLIPVAPPSKDELWAQAIAYHEEPMLPGMPLPAAAPARSAKGFHLFAPTEFVDVSGTGAIRERTAAQVNPLAIRQFKKWGHVFALGCPVGKYDEDKDHCGVKPEVIEVLHPRAEETDILTEAYKLNVPIRGEASFDSVFTRRFMKAGAPPER